MLLSWQEHLVTLCPFWLKKEMRQEIYQHLAQ